MKQNQNRKVRIPDEVKEFGKAKYKKYKKENKEYFDSKKEMKESFYSSQAYNLQYVIDFLVQKKHLPPGVPALQPSDTGLQVLPYTLYTA